MSESFLNLSNLVKSGASGQIENPSKLRWMSHLREDPSISREQGQMEKLVHNLRQRYVSSFICFLLSRFDPLKLVCV